MSISEVVFKEPAYNNNEPLISILTVTLNASDHLPGLIESIRRQDCAAIEWVVVDGASKDGTVDLIQAAGDVITKWTSEPDAGFYDALNKAVRMARGRFYLVMGADDRFEQGAFDALRSASKNAENIYDLMFFPVRRSGRLIFPRKSSRTRLFLGWAFVVASHSVGTLIRTSLHQRMGFYSLRYPLLADGHFMAKALRAGVPVNLRPEVIGEFADGGMTSVDDARIAAETWLIQVHLGHVIFLQTILFLLRVTRLVLAPRKN